jgi:hypothetical protein
MRKAPAKQKAKKQDLKAKKVAKKHAKKAPKKKMVKESVDASNIKEFIDALSSGKYAKANKYLVNVIESKISARNSASLDEPLF